MTDSICYTVVVQQTNSASPGLCYMCGVNAEPGTSLTYGRQIGVGNAVEESIQDWVERITRWEIDNPSFSTWPCPKSLDLTGTVSKFLWTPVQKVYNN